MSLGNPFRRIKIAAAILAAIALPSAATAGVQCELHEFSVVSYDHNGAYLQGMVLNVGPRSFLQICGRPVGTQDCNSAATDRNIAIALTAQARGKPLKLYFSALNSCVDVTNYAPVAAVTLDW